jgi:hypothetical protein
MDARRSGIVDGLDAMKSAGLITRYHLAWEAPGGEPKIAIWRACDTSDEELRKPITDTMAGLLAENQVSIMPGNRA